MPWRTNSQAGVVDYKSFAITVFLPFAFALLQASFIISSAFAHNLMEKSSETSNGWLLLLASSLLVLANSLTSSFIFDLTIMLEPILTSYLCVNQNMYLFSFEKALLFLNLSRSSKVSILSSLQNPKRSNWTTSLALT